MGLVTELLFKRSMENHEKEITRDSSSRMCPDIGATPDIGPDIGKGVPKAGRCPISDIGPDIGYQPPWTSGCIASRYRSSSQRSP